MSPLSGGSTSIPLVVTREDDDPLALRASIGGRAEIGFYLVYRGNPQEVLEMLREVIKRAERELKSGPRG